LDEYIEIINKLPFFEGLSDDDILSVLDCIDTEVLDKKSGEMIYSAGTPFESIIAVLSGSIIVSKNNPKGQKCDLTGQIRDSEDKESIISRLEPGEFFGKEYASTPSTKIDVNVEAETDSVLMLIDLNRICNACVAYCEPHRRMIPVVCKAFDL